MHFQKSPFNTKFLRESSTFWTLVGFGSLLIKFSHARLPPCQHISLENSTVELQDSKKNPLLSNIILMLGQGALIKIKAADEEMTEVIRILC